MPNSSADDQKIFKTDRERTTFLLAKATATVEDWSPLVRIQKYPSLSAVDTGVEKTALENHSFRPGDTFVFKSTRILHHDDVSLAPAIFYELEEKAGWVHDFNPEYPCKRCIKVIAGKPLMATPEPDFVNSQMIISRTLAMALAYPQIEDSVMELVSTMQGTPEVRAHNLRAAALLRQTHV